MLMVFAKWGELHIRHYSDWIFGECIGIQLRIQGPF